MRGRHTTLPTDDGQRRRPESDLQCGALILCALIGTGHVAHAGVNIWTSNGPAGVRIEALAIDPNAPSVIYAGTSPDPDVGGHGGVYKSTDGGQSWQAASRGLREIEGSSYAFTLAIDPLTTTTVYAGGFGLFKSTDAGENWSTIDGDLPDSSRDLGVYALAIDPQASNTVYTGTYGGVYKSTDGGGTWRAANSGLLGPSYTVGALALDPTDPNRLYAGTLGVFVSTDGGDTWRAMNAGLPDFRRTTSQVHPLVIDPATPSTLYTALVTYGVFKSTDSGASWKTVNTGLTTTVLQALAIDPQTPATLYAGTFDGGVFRSTDGGNAWQAISNGLPEYPDVTALAIDPTMAARLYAGTFADGVFAREQNDLLPTPTPIPYPEIHVDPQARTLQCEGEFDITLSNSGGPGTTLVITALQLWHGYSQGYYGQGFTWDTSHITLPASVPTGAALTIPVSYDGRNGSFPSVLHLSCESNARHQPLVFARYTGELCGTPTPTPTLIPTPRRCVGDCNRDEQVIITELIDMVRVVLDTAPLSACAEGDADGDGRIDVSEILQAVDASLYGCAGLLCGGIAGIECGGGFYCLYPPGTCGAGDVTGFCNVRMKRPSPCSPDVVPVCGCDGLTYPHECELLIYGVSKAHDGPCEGTEAGRRP